MTLYKITYSERGKPKSTPWMSKETRDKKVAELKSAGKRIIRTESKAS